MVDTKFNYFKSKILELLAKQEKEESRISKAIDMDIYLGSLFNTMGSVEKSVYGVGTIRVWKGKKYIKGADKKWRRYYDKHTRGINSAISHIRKQIDNCENSEDLLKIVLLHRDRFMDENNKPLPIIQELSNYVSKRNDTIESKITENQWKEIQVVQDELEKLIKKVNHVYSWEMKDIANKLINTDGKNYTEDIVKKWLQLNGLKSMDDLVKYITDKAKVIKEQQDKEKKEKSKARAKNKLQKLIENAGEYKLPETDKKFEKIEINDFPAGFIDEIPVKQSMQKVANYINDNPAEDNNINYLFKNLINLESRRYKYGASVSRINKESNSKFMPTSGIICLKPIDDDKNNVNEIETYIHEMTHFIDNCLYNTIDGTPISVTQQFKNLLSNSIIHSFDEIPENLQKLIHKYDKQNQIIAYRDEKQAEIENLIKENKYEEAKKLNKESNKELKKMREENAENTRPVAALEDMLMALSSGKLEEMTWIHTGFGKNTDMRCKELIAEYIAMSFTRKEELKIFKKELPHVAIMLDNIIVNMVHRLDEFKSRIQKSFSHKLKEYLEK